MQVTMSTTMTQIRFQDMTRPTKIGKLIKYLDFSITTWRTYQTLCSAFLYITLIFFMKPDELEHLDLSLIRNLPVAFIFLKLFYNCSELCSDWRWWTNTGKWNNRLYGKGKKNALKSKLPILSMNVTDRE